MKPHLLKVPYGPANSFSVRKEQEPNVNNRWHYHSEVELIFIHSGHGTQFIGDNISKFSAGDILLIGSNLPHYWVYEDVETDTRPDSYATVIHFFENFMGERFLCLPESRALKNLLERARQGLLLKASKSPEVARLIENIHATEGLNRIIALLECLHAITKEEQVVQLSSVGFKYDFIDADDSRINAVYNFSLTNFGKKIKLQEVASIAGLTESSFCRYFKQQIGKTYSQFLIEIRVGYACKLLIDNKVNIKQVCYESGFNNFSCFHRCFKELTGKTPQLYKQIYS
ncbi:AraC family transcriptional regulator [Mucilaginibacter yixingensis]|uniref:AraC family transcriptional regulator n=1 Tax=Mucilaginibacter yixingensis TaxID=1295612 RepID=A0A2T5JG17_9SPHI|nr:AraC family transcriptional regulator [Mucilaginibacter yixingensis]PTR01306.1 AraC family transcriptional regulator [Mucilaginibacter yixingensis]